MGVRHGSDRPAKLRFSNFEVDLDAGELRKNGLRVKLPDQAFEVLTALLEQAGEVVTREQLQQKLWLADTLVDFDHGLNKSINRIREALCDSASTPRFLETLPRRGYRFIAAVEEITPSPEPPAMNDVLGVTAPVRRAPFARKYILWAAVVVLIALAAAIPSTLLLHHRDAAALSTRSSILVDPASTATMEGLSLSPDGKRLLFTAPIAQASGAVMAWVRPLDSLTAREFPIPGAAGWVFWSPDGRYIAFWNAGTLKKMEVSGGHPVTIGQFSLHSRGGTWSQFDVILFAAFKPGPIYRIPAQGGTPEAVTRIEESRGEIGHRWPFFLPDGQHFLYSARVSLDGTHDEANTIRVSSLDGRTNKFLVYADSNATYAQGYLLFVRNHRLMAQQFDSATLSTTRDAVAIAEPITMVEDYGNFFASASGDLVYRTGADFGTRLVWLDRNGKEVGSVADPGHYYRPRIAPGGHAVAVDVLSDGKVNRDLWIYPLSGGTGTRLTSDPLIHTHPIWSPDGRRIVFAGGASTVNERDVIVRSADADGHDELLVNMPGDKTPSDWSADGRFIAYQLRGPKRTSLSLWILPLFGSRRPFEFRPSAFESKDGQFSPDGRWIAYTSDESGKEEVYVARFPEGSNTRKVSVNGGSQPRWRSDGRELFYLSADDKLMATDVQLQGTTLQAKQVHRLFDCQPARVGIGSVYDVSADGQRFLVSTPSNMPSPPVLITNWTAGLPH